MRSLKKALARTWRCLSVTGRCAIRRALVDAESPGAGSDAKHARRAGPVTEIYVRAELRARIQPWIERKHGRVARVGESHRAEQPHDYESHAQRRRRPAEKRQSQSCSSRAKTRAFTFLISSPCYGKGSARAEEILAILYDARANGIEITADIYPYSASYTGIGIVFPVWAKTREQFDVAKVERREELAEYLRNRVNRRNGPEATLLGTDPYTGKTLADLAHEMELPFEDVLIDVIGPDGGSGAYFVMNDELQARLLADAFIGVCSDGSPTGFHPRGHGTFAKIIEDYVMRDDVLLLEEAIRKLTSFPAELLGIEDRGALLKRG